MACLRFSCRTTLRSSGMCAFHFFSGGFFFLHRIIVCLIIKRGFFFVLTVCLLTGRFAFLLYFGGDGNSFFLSFFQRRRRGGGEDSIRVHIYLLKRALSFFFSFSTYHSWLVHQEVLVINGFFLFFFEG
jgi:hypothetical protein